MRHNESLLVPFSMSLSSSRDESSLENPDSEVPVVTWSSKRLCLGGCGGWALVKKRDISHLMKVHIWRLARAR